MSGPYDDILDLPHHVSTTHPPMPMADRAAQFSPFAALTGYDDAIRETARRTDRRAEPSEEVLAMLDQKLRLLARQPGAAARFTWFVPDVRKAGGAYVTVEGVVRRIDTDARRVLLENGTLIPLNDVLEIEVLDE